MKKFEALRFCRGTGEVDEDGIRMHPLSIALEPVPRGRGRDALAGDPPRTGTLASGVARAFEWPGQVSCLASVRRMTYRQSGGR